MADTLFQNGTVVQPTWLNDVNTAVYDRLTAVAGTNTITATGPLTMSAYTAGQNFYFTPAVTNTGATTINISGLGAKAITKNGAAALVAGDLVAGTVYELSYDGTQFQVLNPSNNSVPAVNITGQVAIANGGTGESTLIPTGQCRLVKSGANLLLQRYNGDKLAFPARYASIPAAGIALVPTSLAVGTSYFIYAVQTAGVVSSLEASTTGHTPDTTTGIEIKTGDPTRILVGMARTITGPAWQDTANQRFVISWYNQTTITGFSFYTTNRTVPSTTVIEPSTEIRVEFLSFARGVSSHLTGWASNSTPASGVFTYLALDGAAGDPATLGISATGGGIFPVSISGVFSVTEGYHYVTLVGGCVISGTATYPGSAVVGARVTLYVSVVG